MTRVRAVDEADVEAVASWLDLTFAAGEAADAADRLDTLAGIYADLEDVPVDAMDDRGGEDRFVAPPVRPGPDEDPHNAWLQRFDLRRPGDGPLSGLDVAIKDNTCVRGVEITCGSRALEGFAPAGHAAVVDRVLDAGGRIVGKTNMDELAFGPTSETSAYGATLNPRDRDHVAGGSSSGSAAAVAAGEADLALGTDTGGSVRIPASYCGIVGLKPTYGRVSLHGIVELAYSMDHAGPLARDVETAAVGLDAFADDPPARGDSYAGAVGDVAPEDLTVGVSEAAYRTHVSAAVEGTVRDEVAALESAGAEVVDVEIPPLAHSRPGWWGIAPVEFAAAYLTNGVGLWRHGRAEESLTAALTRLRRSDSRHLGTNVKEMLALGAHLLTTHDGYHYARARSYRAVLREAFDDALADVDILVGPGTPTTAQEVDGFERGVTPPVNWNTHPTNLTGHPSVVLPCGEDDDGLPVSLQFVAPWGAERDLLAAAAAYERDV
ncbi:MAG: amidase [Haloferacaceae archaeon]